MNKKEMDEIKSLLNQFSEICVDQNAICCLEALIITILNICSQSKIAPEYVKLMAYKLIENIPAIEDEEEKIHYLDDLIN